MKYSELFFLYSYNQSNIYNLSIFPQNDDVNKNNLRKFILLFYLKPANEMLKQNYYLISIDSNKTSIHSSQKHLDFPDINGEVVSIDSNIDFDSEIISIILCVLKKQKENKPKSLVQIYEANYKPDKMDKIKPTLVFKKDLGFNPLQVTHTKYWNNSLEKICWVYVVSLSDECIYSKQKDKPSSLFSLFKMVDFSDNPLEFESQSASSSRSSSTVATESDKKLIRRILFNEKIVKKRPELEDIESRYEDSSTNVRKAAFVDCSNNNRFFPELLNINQKILYMNFKIIEERFQRISCFGSDAGMVLMYVIDMIKSECLYSFRTEHNSPITSIKLIDSSRMNELETLVNDSNDYDVLVCSAIEQAVVYKNVLINKGFHRGNQNCLKESDFYDCVLCSAVADVDMDGELEIMIGTFQNLVLIYKWFNSNGNDNGAFRLVSKQKCAGPVHRIEHVDITQDGVCELVVLTTRGLHIFQLNTDYVMNIIIKRLSLK